MKKSKQIKQLQAENDRLKHDIEVLVKGEPVEELLIIKLRWKIRLDLLKSTEMWTAKPTLQGIFTVTQQP